MRSIFYTIVIAASATAALAQAPAQSPTAQSPTATTTAPRTTTTLPPAVNAPGNNAVNSSGANNSNAPVAGANSFTQAQAKSRIEAKGYSSVSGLKKDDKGIWRGMASKDGKSVNVSLDFQGNINAR